MIIACPCGKKKFEVNASLIPRENLVVICTGSQGEKRSALFRIAYNSHNNIYLEKSDLVIFSSKDIPGNEKAINNLKNLLYAQNVEVITSDDDLVHVSGHGYAEEIKKMIPNIYKCLRKDGEVVFSGILNSQKDEIIKILIRNNLKLLDVSSRKDWVCISAQKANNLTQI